MSWNQSPFSRPRALACAGIFLVLLGSGALVYAFTGRGVKSAAPEAIAAPMAGISLRGWRIETGGDGRGPQRFGGVFAPGQVLFIPAGARFLVSPQPSSCAGIFKETSAEANFDHNGGELSAPRQHNGAWVQEGRAPLGPGMFTLNWQPREGSSSATLTVVTLVPSEAHTQGEKTYVKVNGKSIGAYHDPAQSTIRRVRENANLYRRPEFFASFTPEMYALKIAPDFELGQLIAFKDFYTPEGKKVYTNIRHTDVLPPRPELIDKLAKLRERLRSKGVKVTKFWITSGFRTPDYNHSIGGAAYSRHCYGDAVDLVIDEDGDKKMDDLNGDGRIDRKDGIIVGNACRELELEGAAVPGGIGVYEWQSDDSVGSHIHIDCRGYISRWGQVGSGRYKKTFLWWPKAEFQEEEAGE